MGIFSKNLLEIRETPLSLVVNVIIEVIFIIIKIANDTSISM